jgi:hypothetical protein
MLTNAISPSTLIKDVRREICGPDEDTIRLSYGYGFRQATHEMRSQGVELIPLQSEVTLGLDKLLEEKRLSKFMIVMRELSEHPHTELMEGIKPRHITQALALMMGRSRVVFNLSASENIIALAIAIADKPDLHPAFKEAYTALPEELHRMTSVVLAGRVENGSIHIPDDVFEKMITELGLAPRSVFDGEKRWDQIPFVPEGHVEEIQSTARVTITGALEPYFCKRGAVREPGDLPSPDAVMLKFAHGYDVDTAYVGELIPATEALQRAQEAHATCGTFRFARARAIMHTVHGLQALVATEPKAEVVWRTHHHGDVPGYVRPLRENAFVVRENRPIPRLG